MFETGELLRGSAVNFLHKDFHLEAGDEIEVTFNHPANVQLLDIENYEAYRQGKPYQYHGGYATESPVRLPAPAAGTWHLVVDLGGAPGSVRASYRLLTPQTA